MTNHCRFAPMSRKIRGGSFVLLLLFSGLGLTGRGQTEEPVAPAGAVRQVLDAQVAAWNKGDLERFMAGYWHSPELSFFSGNDKRRGWEETLSRYRQRYQAEGKEMGKLSFTDLEIESPAPDMAWVRGRFKLVMSKETPSGLFTLIFKKLPEGWRIVHDHTSG
jgi:ketosteroid isomerase-like protein